MAAHIVTALKDFARMETNRILVHLPNWMDYTASGGQLHWQDYKDLLDAIENNDPAWARFKLSAMMPRYGERWLELNEPRTYEEWVEAEAKEEV